MSEYIPEVYLGSSLRAPNENEVDEGSTALPSGETDALQLFLEEVSCVRSLTSDQEIALAQRIEAGDQEAREELISANLGLVVAVASTHTNRGLSLEDLIQEGSLGLIRAVDLYNHKIGKFSSYAITRIKYAILDALAEKERAIRLPDRQYHATRRLAYVEERLRLELGRQPIDHEIAAEMGFDAGEVAKLRVFADQESTSLETPTNGGRDRLVDMIPARDDVEGEALDRYTLEVALRPLSPRERLVLEWRFGLRGPEYTLEEVGQMLGGVGSETVRQIQCSAFKKIRAQVA